MKIDYNNKTIPHFYEFSAIPVGEPFKYGDTVYMKTADTSSSCDYGICSKFNAVNLGSAELTYFGSGAVVIKLEYMFTYNEVTIPV